MHRSRTGKAFILTTALLLFLSGAPCAAEVSFHILMVNDPHSYILPYTEAAPDGGVVKTGGLDRALWLVEREREAVKAESAAPVFFVEGGDIMLGIKGSALAGGPEYTALALKGCDIGVLGNHEFDGGAKTLAKLGAALKFPVLASNVTFDDKKLDALFPKTVILERGGVKIGFFGLVTPEILSIVRGAEGFRVDENLAEHARRRIAELTARGARIIAAVNHIGLDADKKLASETAGIDIIVGGHSHSVVRDKLVVAGPDGSQTIIGQAGLDGRYAGCFDITVTDDGRLLPAKSSWKLMPVEDGTPEDKVIHGIGLKAREELANVLSIESPAAVFTGPADGRSGAVRTSENALGSMTAEAMRYAVLSRIGVYNGGGVRIGRVVPKGPFSACDMLDLLPYGNRIVRALVTGEELRRQLEISASSLVGPNDRYDAATRCHNGEFLHVAGLRVVIDVSRTPALVSKRKMTRAGERVVEVLVDGPNGWEPLDDGKIYSVGSNEYELASWNCLKMSFIDETDIAAVNRYFGTFAGRIFTPRTDGRISIMNSTVKR